jgi:hypothetical protein
MKYKKKLEWLKMKQNWFDKLPRSMQAALTRPGSIKTA